MNYTQNGNWVSRAVFPGVSMGYSASFVVGGNAYVGTGYNPQDQNNRLQTMFQYIPATQTSTTDPNVYQKTYGAWQQVSPIPGKGRSNAVGFAVGNFGYVGSGTSDGFTPLADFYKYDPVANSWTTIDSLWDGTKTYPRFDAVAFGFDNAGYVLTGTDNNYQFGDVWKYDPNANTWTKQANMPGSPRSQAATWVYKGQGYLLTGYTTGGQWSSGNACYDFWKFDPNASTGNAWIRLRDIFDTSPDTYDDGYTNIIRYHAAAFTISGTKTGDKGYITTGSNGTLYNYTWEYDFATDLWVEKTPYEGAARQGAVGFTIGGNRGFVATGVSGSGWNDLREFFPDQIYNQYD